MIPMKRVIYKCDPKKNTQCKRTSCKYRERSKLSVIEYDYLCEGTSNPEYAVKGEDGKPIILYDVDV